ncbi:hypothetical protein RND81_10G064100 [Saponaria officinalis]|uniref:ABC transporter domain-containing protein n=1 Tax=Saponaria officinalis TaxID=3572 RepID=A0AAW1I007_SAPOF
MHRNFKLIYPRDFLRESSKSQESDANVDSFLSSAQHARNSGDSQLSFMDESHNSGKLGVEIKGENPSKETPKKKTVNSESRNFEYAYAQIVKKKTRERQSENLKISGVVSMTTVEQLKKRPSISIAFKDITLTLKCKKKRLLKNLTGKIMPSRIAAVMGPSGAGKTTFLSALAGKATGCTKKGLVLINGKPESIHSHRKIVGFVPQDDIVHGNLTVEENLWFSARCRYVHFSTFGIRKI